jgi:hypothetical protein
VSERGEGEENPVPGAPSDAVLTIPREQQRATSILITDPRTGAEVGRVEQTPDALVPGILDRSRRAAARWALTPPAERGALLRAASSCSRAETACVPASTRSCSTPSSGRCTGAARCRVPGTPPT